MDFDIVLDVVPELIIFDVLDYPRARRTYLDLFTCFFITWWLWIHAWIVMPLIRYVFQWLAESLLSQRNFLTRRISISRSDMHVKRDLLLLTLSSLLQFKLFIILFSLMFLTPLSFIFYISRISVFYSSVAISCVLFYYILIQISNILMGFDDIDSDFLAVRKNWFILILFFYPSCF